MSILPNWTSPSYLLSCLITEMSSVISGEWRIAHASSGQLLCISPAELRIHCFGQGQMRSWHGQIAGSDWPVKSCPCDDTANNNPPTLSHSTATYTITVSTGMVRIQYQTVEYAMVLGTSEHSSICRQVLQWSLQHHKMTEICSRCVKPARAKFKHSHFYVSKYTTPVLM